MVIPANEKITLMLCFASEDVGHFDEILHFEVVGQRCPYQLNCRGVSSLPTINKEPRFETGIFSMFGQILWVNDFLY